MTYSPTLRRLMAIVAIALLLIPYGCSDDKSGSNLPNDRWYDIVTIESIYNKGSSFTLQKDGDSELITYTSSYPFLNDTTVHVGDRIIIMYLRADDAPAYTSGAINLYGYRKMDNSPQQALMAMPAEIKDFNPEWIDVQSMTRTGQYINVQARLSCYIADAPAVWCMVADPETLLDPYPTLNILYQAKSPGQNYTLGYASWDISEIWAAPTCQGVTVRCKSKDGYTEQTFDK